MPTLNVSSTPEFVEKVVSSGSHVSASDVVRDALRLMRQDQKRAAAKLALLRKAIDAGLGQSERREFSKRSISNTFSAAARAR